MKEIFSKRLKSARALAAISQDELVARMGGMVSKNAISKYERGEMMPDGKVLLALSKALKVKPDYFFRELQVEINKIEFRKKSKLSAKRVNAIKEHVIDFVERYLELEQFLDIKSGFQNPIAHMVVQDRDDVEAAAKTLLKKWKLGVNALPNVIDLLEDKEIKVIEIDAPEAFDGFSGWADNKFPIIVLNQNFTVERKRLTALHELGHLVLNFSSDLEHRDIERKCFQFAAAMLIPEETFKEELGERRTHVSIHELIAIKEVYGISIQAIMARAKDLGVISEHLFVNFRKWISGNKTEEGLGNYIGKESSTRFKQLLYRAASEEIISLSKAANLSNQKLAAFRQEFVAL